MPESSDYETRFGGVARLVGPAGLERLRAAHVCVAGVGGVGSWTAEALARSGVGSLTLIDLDEVCVSNVNRQLPALTSEIGRPKVQVLKERILGINPECAVEPVEEFFTAQTAERLLARPYSYVVDAIDSLANKCLLLARCRDRGVPVITLGGAGGRSDPTAIRVADLAFSSHDRLLRAVRKTLRAGHGFPADDQAPFGIPSVFSCELPVVPGPGNAACRPAPGRGAPAMNCNGGYGSAAFVTGAFGFAAAAIVVRDLASGAFPPAAR